MTRPRPTVAEVIRSVLDEFLERVRSGADARATPHPQRPGRLPHRGSGRPCPGVPRVRASADRLQLLRQPPLPHLPGHGRGTVAGGPRRRVAPRAVLPPRLHAAGCPRPDRPGAIPGSSTTCCSAAPPRPCSRWPRTPTTSAPAPACWPCCTPWKSAPRFAPTGLSPHPPSRTCSGPDVRQVSDSGRLRAVHMPHSVAMIASGCRLARFCHAGPAQVDRADQVLDRIDRTWLQR